MSTDDWSIHIFSKLFRFLGLIRCFMENSIQELVKTSVVTYCSRLCEPCTTFQTIAADFEWDDDLQSSPFVPPGRTYPVFLVTLQINRLGAVYSTPPQDFAPSVIQAFDDAIRQTHFIEIIDRSVMTNLIFANGMYLSSLGLQSDGISVQRERLRLCYERATIPLNAYARKFDKFVEIHELNVESYMSSLGDAEKSTAELRDLIEHYIQSQDHVNVYFPETLVIGPFCVNVKDLKDFLLNKHEVLLHRLLRFLAQKLTAETQLIVDELKGMFDRLCRHPSSIEQKVATTEWMALLPDLVAHLERHARMKLYEYDILDGFWHSLEDPEADVKWNALIYPYRIRSQIGPTERMFETAVEQFAKQHTSDLVAFGEQIEGLNSGVFNFASYSDVTRASEYFVEANKLANAIADAEKLGAVLNRRQELFDRPVMDTSSTRNLADTFAPFKDLWGATAEFLKLRETTYGNPLNNVDLNRTQETAMGLRERLDKAEKAFPELPHVTNAVRHFQDQMQEFEEAVMVMDYIRSPIWTVKQWLELSKVSSVDVQPSAALNFGQCIEHNILVFRDVVRDVLERATADKQRRDEEQLEELRQKMLEDEAREIRKKVRRGRKLE